MVLDDPHRIFRLYSPETDFRDFLFLGFSSQPHHGKSFFQRATIKFEIKETKIK